MGEGEQPGLLGLSPSNWSRAPKKGSGLKSGQSSGKTGKLGLVQPAVFPKDASFLPVQFLGDIYSSVHLPKAVTQEGGSDAKARAEQQHATEPGPETSREERVGLAGALLMEVLFFGQEGQLQAPPRIFRPELYLQHESFPGKRRWWWPSMRGLEQFPFSSPASAAPAQGKRLRYKHLKMARS